MAFAEVGRGFSNDFGDDQRELVTFSIITMAPNELMRDTHPDRMPVILDPDYHEVWLTAPPDNAFSAHPLRRLS